MRPRSTVEAELRALCGKNSHPEHPLLRAGSRYPATDFTPWVADRLSKGAFDEVAYLVSRLNADRYRMGPDQEECREAAIALCYVDLHQAIDCRDPKAYLDIHSALLLHGGPTGDVLTDLSYEGGYGGYLVTAMCPYEFAVVGAREKVEAANELIREMWRESDDVFAERGHKLVWSDLSLLTLADIESIGATDPSSFELRARLRTVSIAARQMFIGTLKEGPGQGGWEARPFGIDEDRAGTELVDAGLAEYMNDLDLVLWTYTKQDLLDALAGYPTKSGWSKKYTVKYMTENALEVCAALCQGRKVVAVRPEWIPDGIALTQWIKKVKLPLCVALAFKRRQKGAARVLADTVRRALDANGMITRGSMAVWAGEGTVTLDRRSDRIEDVEEFIAASEVASSLPGVKKVHLLGQDKTRWIEDNQP